jgi:tetratricopeptide (TPR) repeat protein
MTNSHPYRGSAAAAAPAISDSIEAARALRTRGRTEEALGVLIGPIKLSAEFYILRGDLQFELNMLEDAADSYTSALASEPDNLCAHYNLGVCLREMQRWAAARACFEKLLAYDPHRDHVRIALADCLLHLNQPEEALVHFDQCWSQPERTRVLFGKAAALQLLHRFDEAEVLYQRVLALDPKAEEALSNLIAIGMEAFDLPRVQAHAQQLLQISPQSVIALQALTLVALERRDYDTAARNFSRLIESAGTHDRGSNGELADAIEYRLGREALEALNARRRASSGIPRHASDRD